MEHLVFIPFVDTLVQGLMLISHVTMYFRVQVPEQQQDQRVGARSFGPSELNSAGPQAEPKPYQPDSRESLPAPEADPAVSAPGCHQNTAYQLMR